MSVAFPLLVTGTALAQSGEIRGKVIDATTGESLPNANILVKELGRGASSDINGNYSIMNIPAGTYTVSPASWVQLLHPCCSWRALSP